MFHAKPKGSRGLTLLWARAVRQPDGSWLAEVAVSTAALGGGDTYTVTLGGKAASEAALAALRRPSPVRAGPDAWTARAGDAVIAAAYRALALQERLKTDDSAAPGVLLQPRSSHSAARPSWKCSGLGRLPALYFGAYEKCQQQSRSIPPQPRICITLNS